MKNKDVFAKEIIDIACKGGSLSKIKGVLCECNTDNCYKCDFQSMFTACNSKINKWAESEYIQKEIDWSKVPVDTPVFSENGERHHFARYNPEKNEIYVFTKGRTSWTCCGDTTNEYKGIELAKLSDRCRYIKDKEQ